MADLVQQLARLGIKVDSDGVADANKRLDDMDKKGGKAEKSVSKLEQRLDKLNKVAEKTGKFLTKFVTLPILGLGTLAVKLSSDFNESLNKIDVAFGNSQDVILDWSKTTADNIGVSQGKAMDMVATMGDMATSMGLTQKAAAEMGKEIVNRAGDLASFKNIRIDMAETALKGIYTGETESLKGLGVVMTQANLAAYALSQGITKNMDDMTQAEKVMLRYNFVMDATSNSAGDFARTSDSLANRLRSIKARAENIAVALGDKLLPIAERLAEKVLDLLDKLSKLDDKQLEMILTMAGVAAAAGPTISAIGGISKAIGFLAANPIVAAIAGIAALTAGIVILIEKSKSHELDRLGEKFGNIGISANATAEEIKKVRYSTQQIEMAWERFAGGMVDSDILDFVTQLSESSQFTASEIAQMGLLTQDLTADMQASLQAIIDNAEAEAKYQEQRTAGIQKANEEYRAYMATIEGTEEYLAEKRQISIEKANAQYKAYMQSIEPILEIEEDVTTELEKQLEAIRKQVIANRGTDFEQFEIAKQAAQDRLNLGLIDEIGYKQEILSATENYVDALIESGYVQEGVNQNFKNYVQQIKDLRAELEDTAETAVEIPKSYAQGFAEVQAEMDRVAEMAEDYHKSESEKTTAIEDRINEILESIDSGVSQKAEQLQDLDQLLESGSISWDQYTEAVEKANKALTELAAKQLLTNLGKAALDAAISGMEELGSVVADIALNGDKAGKSFEDAMLAIGESILRALPNLFLQAGLQVIGINLPLGLALIAAAGISAFGVGMVDEVKSQTPNAQGNIFDNGNIIPYSRGDIVDRPTYFPMRNGSTGLMGEKGIEAIMPVKRMSDGNLGVEASGSATRVNVTVINNTGENVETTEKQTGDTREIEIVIGNVVKKKMSDGSLDSAMRSNYGVKRQGVPG